MAPLQGKGRRKTEMKLIEDESARTVTFSKRRVGVFKKANELSILCGAQIVVIVFSLSGKAYSFGHPDVASVIHRFLRGDQMPNLQMDSVGGPGIRTARLKKLKDQLDEKMKELDAEKRRGRELEEGLEGSPYCLTEEGLEEMDFEQLKELKEKIEKLREDLHVQANALPKVEPVESSISMNVAMPAVPVEVNLANVGRDERNASPIPPDWLKL